MIIKQNTLYLCTILTTFIIACPIYGAAAMDEREDVLEVSPLDIEFLNAVKKGDLDKVKDLVAQGANIDAMDENEYTALIQAANMNYPKIVEFLIEKGANVNAVEYSGKSALILACGRNYKAIMQLLLDAGADVNACDDEFKETALMVAVNKRNVNTLKLLLDYGADLDQKNEYGRTALGYAQDIVFACSGNKVDEKVTKIIELLENEKERRTKATERRHEVTAAVIASFAPPGLADLLVALLPNKLIEFEAQSKR